MKCPEINTIKTNAFRGLILSLLREIKNKAIHKYFVLQIRSEECDIMSFVRKNFGHDEKYLSLPNISEKRVYRTQFQPWGYPLLLYSD